MNHSRIRGRVVFRQDMDTQRFVLSWCLVDIDGAIRSWGPFCADFPSALEAIAYGKNVVLKHPTEKGLVDAVEHMEWWIKGDLPRMPFPART